MKTATIYTGSSGEENRVTAERMSFDGETGLTSLQESENVFVDPSGMVQGMKGHVVEDAGSWHSLTIGSERGREVGFAVKERPDLGYAIIARIETDNEELIITPIGGGLASNRRMSWAWAGDVGGWKVFFSNGQDFGWIEGGHVVSSGWPTTENNPDPDTTEDYRQLNDFFVSKTPYLLGWSGYRMFFAFEDAGAHCLGITMHGFYGLWRRRDWLQWPDRIIMYAPVRDGHYVGTTIRIYFIPTIKISSDSLAEFVVADYPPLEGGLSAKPVNPSHFGFESNAPSYITATATGPVMLLPGGNLINLIDKSLSFQALDKGALGILNDSLIIQSREA